MESKNNLVADILTNRETEILTLIASGYSNTKIGTVLNISSSTVTSHRSNIRRKLHVNNVAGMVRYALQNELIK